MTTPRHLRALLYCAVSTPEQARDDKESLVAQEREQRAVCEQFDWQIVDTLHIPGFSRRYLDLHDFAAGAAAEAIEDGWKLVQHLERSDFDVFLCRDGDRFGRSQALLARIAEDILFIQKKFIYAVRGGGLISEKAGGREWITMQSYRAAKEIDDLIYKRAIGMQKRFDLGRPAGKLPLSHRPIRDDKGKLVDCEPKPELAALWRDLVEVLCDGVAWDAVGIALYERYGHARPNGKPWLGRTLRVSVLNPIFWGHNAKNHNNKRDGRRFGLWSFDPSYPPPDDIQVAYNVFPPALMGEPAVRLASELRRRSIVVVGRARPHRTHRFSGLLVCYSCGYRMRFSEAHHSYRYYACNTRSIHKRTSERAGSCEAAKNVISEANVQRWLHKRIEQMLTADNPSLLANLEAEKPSPDYVASLREELARTEQRAEGLLLQQAATPPQLQETLTRLILEAADQMGRLRASLDAALRQDMETAVRTESIANAYEKLRVLKSIDEFWEWPDHEINQVLFDAMGGRVLVVVEGEIRYTTLAGGLVRSTKAAKLPNPPA